MFRVHVPVLRDSIAFVPIAIVDLLRKASALPGVRRAVEPLLVAVGSSLTVTAAGGIAVKCQARIADVTTTDLVIVPPVDPDLTEHLAQNAAVVPWLRTLYARGADVASACTGAFLLGDAGLLDNRSATTHWAFQDRLARAFPKTRVLPQAIIVDQGRILTAGGATSFLNLVLHIVERLHGIEVSRACTRSFLVDPNKSPQSAYAIFASQKSHGDPEILRAQELIEQRPAHVPTVARLAKLIAMSPRTFARRFVAATGNTPLAYTQRVRIEAAKRALEAGARVGTVAHGVGYSDEASFRRLFGSLTGLSPAEYRARYGPASAPATIRRK
ncbi:MAG: helix-turn-helix domain-containing protein [Kofleriaceae bacterium]